MSKRSAVTTCLLVGSAFLGALAHALWTDSPSRSARLEYASSPAQGAVHVESIRPELVAWRAMEEHHERLLRNSTEPPETGSKPAPAQEREPVPGQAELAAREHEIGTARLDSLMAAFDNEVQDPLWAPDMEARIAAVMGARQGTTLTSVTCRSTRCRVELEHNSRIDLERLPIHLHINGLSRGFLMHEGLETQGPYHTVIIFGRDAQEHAR